MKNLGDQLQTKDLLPVQAITGDGNATGIDCSDLSGEIAVIADISAPVAGTNPTMDLKLQHCDTVGGTYADVTGGAFTQVTDTASVQKLSLNKDELKKFLRIVKDIGGTSSPQYLASVKAVGLKQYRD